MVGRSRPVHVLLTGDDAHNQKREIIESYIHIFRPKEINIPLELREPYKLDIDVDNNPTSIFLYDITGYEAEADREERIPFYRNKDVVLVCFNAVNTNSLGNVEKVWWSEAQRRCPDKPLILVGTSSELQTTGKMYGLKTVSVEEGYEAANKLGAWKYHQASVKNADTIRNLFDEAVRAAFGMDSMSPRKPPLSPEARKLKFAVEETVSTQLSDAITTVEAAKNTPHNAKLLDKLRDLVVPVNTLRGLLNQQRDHDPVHDESLKTVTKVLSRVEESIEKVARRQSSVTRFFMGSSDSNKLLSVVEELNHAGGEVQKSIDALKLGIKIQNEQIVRTDLAAQGEHAPKCVQCEKPWHPKMASDDPCYYHAGRLVYDDRGFCRFECCWQTCSHPWQAAELDKCEKGRHRTAHHADYPYQNYFEFADNERMKIRYPWVTVGQEDWEDDMKKEVAVGLDETQSQLYIAISKGSHCQFVRSFEEPRDALYAVTLNEMGKPKSGKHLLVERKGNSSGHEWYVLVSWLVEESQLVGVEIEVKSMTSERPDIHTLRFRTTPWAKGQHIPVQQWKVQSLTGRYEVPPKRCVGDAVFPFYVTDDPPKSVELETEGEMNVRFRLDDPSVANVEMPQPHMETFDARLMLLHLGPRSEREAVRREERLKILGMVERKKVNIQNALELLSATDKYAAPDDPLTIVAIYSEVLIDGVWVEADDTDLVGMELPFEVQPRGGTNFTVRVIIKSPGKSHRHDLERWHGRGFMARFSPQPIRIIVEEIDGKRSWVVIDHHNPMADVTVPDVHDLYFTYCDDFELYNRHAVRITRGKVPESIIVHCGNRQKQFDMTGLRSIGYKANKEGMERKEVDYLTHGDGEGQYVVTALVDPKKAIVYGFHFDIKSTTGQVQDSWLLDLNPPKAQRRDAGAIVSSPTASSLSKGNGVDSSILGESGAWLCSKCGYGQGRLQCVKCWSPYATNRSHMCLACRAGVAGTQCAKCHNPAATIPANVCESCKASKLDRECVKCGLDVSNDNLASFREREHSLWEKNQIPPPQ